MILKIIVRYIINKYMKDYIERLDDEKLKLNLKHGNVLLENLHLKPEALVGLGIPVTVATGFIEVHQDLHEYHAEKMKRVQRKLDNLRKAGLDEQKLDEKEKGFFEKIKFQMLQNLEITLRNFHISYETKSTTKLGHPFSFGITIHYLQLTTTTNKERLGKVKENTLVIAQFKEIKWLSLYWNTNCTSRIHMPFEYVVVILHPVNLNFAFKVGIKFAEQNFQRPIYKIKFQIEQISFGIDPKQFSDLLDFIKFQNYSVFYDRCREYRQLCLKDVIGNTKLTKEEQDRIQILESKLDAFTMAYIRHSVELETHLYSDTSAYHDYSWWSWWWNERTNLNHGHHRIIKGNMHDEDEFFSEELLDIDAQITINELDLALLSPSKRKKLNEKNKIITHIIMENTRIDYKRRAISSSILVVLDLEYFRIFGLKSNEQHQPLILTSSSKSLNSLIHLEFELAPIHKKADFRFLLIIEPLSVIYHAATINEIVAHFEPIDKNTYSLSSQIKQRTFLQMEHDLSNKKIFDMTMQIKGLSLFLPEYGYFKHDCKTMIIRFTNLKLSSCLNDDDREQDDALFQKQMRERRYYIKYKFLLNDLEIIYSESSKEQLRILRAIPLIDTNFYKCIYSDDAQLTDWRIAVKIVQMAEIELSRMIMTKLNKLHRSVPLFYSAMSETLNRINLFFNIFPPHTSIECNISINKCSFIIMNSKTSIKTHISCHILKTRNEDEYSKSIRVILKNLSMILHSSLISIQSSWPFYQNNAIELLYSDTDTKL
ncbi:unnamed protein product [Rotaria sordida]|uniref:Uncharacterized protein n=1 Tax=Rotaria sordida TaxID=392033 RepID=A0A813UT88_9BILA|nr:unnamed protein product [Rotaria sordida]CAF0832082.1 unnamed protein product [Rotaria sordida]